MNEEVRVEETSLGVAPSRLRRVSWGAIFAAVFFATVLQAMFTLLGAAVGFGPLRPVEQSNPAQATAIGAGIWMLVTGLVSIWIGACVAGRLSGGHVGRTECCTASLPGACRLLWLSRFWRRALGT